MRMMPNWIRCWPRFLKTNVLEVLLCGFCHKVVFLIKLINGSFNLSNVMKLQLTLRSDSLEAVSLPVEQLNQFGSTPLVNARVELLNVAEGKILHQSADHYVAQLELYEAFLEKDLKVEVSVEVPTIVMCLVFKGNFNLSKESCSTIPGHVPTAHCYICKVQKGNFYSVVPSGNHKTLVLIFKPDWLDGLRNNLECLEPLFHGGADEIHTLPCCRINRVMMQAVKKLEAVPNKRVGADTISYVQVEQLITQYHNLLVAKNYLTSFINREKAQALTIFIQKNFTLPIVKDMTEMASIFCMSEKSLARLGYVAFDTTIHEHVLKLRMARGMKLLLFTDKSIKEVAILSGYDDPFFFSKTFKKKFGLAPSEIYRHHKK